MASLRTMRRGQTIIFAKQMLAKNFEPNRLLVAANP